MTGDRAKDDQILRLVRKHVAGEDLGEADWQEPDEPLPQDCCGQSCIPCVFDIHRKDLVEWAKEIAKKIKHGDSNLYHFVYGESEESEGKAKGGRTLETYTFLEITAITPMTTETNLYSFAVQGLRLPLGAHLRARTPCGVGHVSRQYTPTAIYRDSFQVPIKIYEDGKFTRVAKEWTVGTRVEWRGPYVTEHGEWLKDASHLLLVAAGTGIAPFIRIVEHLLSDDDCSLRITLVFCTRSIEDVLFKETLDRWTRHWNFSLTLVVSDPNSNSTAPHLASVQKGSRLSQDLFCATLRSISSAPETIRVAVCGSKTFEKDVINFATRGGGGGLKSSQVFRFPG